MAGSRGQPDVAATSNQLISIVLTNNYKYKQAAEKFEDFHMCWMMNYDEQQREEEGTAAYVPRHVAREVGPASIESLTVDPARGDGDRDEWMGASEDDG